MFSIVNSGLSIDHDTEMAVSLMYHMKLSQVEPLWNGPASYVGLVRSTVIWSSSLQPPRINSCKPADQFGDGIKIWKTTTKMATVMMEWSNWAAYRRWYGRTASRTTKGLKNKQVCLCMSGEPTPQNWVVTNTCNFIMPSDLMIIRHTNPLTSSTIYTQWNLWLWVQAFLLIGFAV